MLGTKRSTPMLDFCNHLMETLDTLCFVSFPPAMFIARVRVTSTRIKFFKNMTQSCAKGSIARSNIPSRSPWSRLIFVLFRVIVGGNEINVTALFPHTPFGETDVFGSEDMTREIVNYHDDIVVDIPDKVLPVIIAEVRFGG